MSTENKIDNTPPTEAEVDQFIAGLSDADKIELRRQQLVAAAVSRKPDKAPDLGAMTQGEFEAYKRSIGL